jgi:hypothetical protein
MHPLETLIEQNPASRPASSPKPLAETTVVAGEAVSSVGAAGSGGTVASSASPAPAAEPLTPTWPMPPGMELKSIPWPAPCPRCGSFAIWWDFCDRQRCQQCERQEVLRGMRMIYRGAKIREREREQEREQNRN